MKTVEGWIILHPNGVVELDYFHTVVWITKADRSKQVSVEHWRKVYRPACRMVRAALVFDTGIAAASAAQPKMKARRKIKALPRPGGADVRRAVITRGAVHIAGGG